MEEENYLDKPASEITADILSSDVTPYVLGGGLTTAAGSARGGAVKFDPRILGNMQTQVMKNAPGGKFRLLADPKYIQYAKNTLPQAISKNPMSVASASVIPATAATIAYDVVKGEADKTTRSLEEMYDQVDNLSSDPDGLAKRLRKLNIIEEQKAFDEGRAPFGGEEGITMGNLDEYLAANPDFSGIGDVKVPDMGYDKGGQFLPEKPGKYSFEDEIGTPGLDVYQGGVDYSSAFQGSKAGGNAQIEGRPRSPLEIHTEYLGNLEKQGVSADERAEIASRMLAPFVRGAGDESRAAFERASAEREARIGQPEPGDISRGMITNALPDLSMGDYRNILRQQGIKGSAQLALAKQMMQEDAAEKRKSALNRDLIRAQIAKAQQPKAPRAPTTAELQIGVIDQMTQLQSLIDAGKELTPEQQMAYDSGNLYLQMQDPFGQAPFQKAEVKDPNNGNTLPSSTDPKGKELIAKMKKKYPGSSEEDILTALRSANKLA